MWHTIQSSLPELLAAGFKYTIPLALVSFFWGLLIALFRGADSFIQTKWRV